jgi:hypothetical protein
LSKQKLGEERCGVACKREDGRKGRDVRPASGKQTARREEARMREFDCDSNLSYTSKLGA